MDRVSKEIFGWLQNNVDLNKKIIVFAGVGNNGSDGLAVARLLAKDKRQVEVFIVNFNENPTDDFLKNLGGIVKAKNIKVNDLYSCSQIPECASDCIVIDAIFGVGFNRYVPEWIQSIFQKINKSASYIVSIDIPSGFYMDKVPLSDEIFIKPNVVLTFQMPRLIFLLPQTGKYIPKWEILDIGLDRTFLRKIEAEYQYITKEDIQEIYKPRERFSHKGTFGHALLVGGSYGKIGAMVLSSSAVLRSGAGLLTVLVPQCGYDILQTAVPEAMVITSDGEKFLSPTEISFTPSAIGVGVGMDTLPQTASLLFALFEHFTEIPFVIDADALNLLAQHPDQLNKLPQNAILTPHSRELERLIGTWKDDFDKIEKAKKFAKKHRIILILKDAYSIVTDGKYCWINSTGNAGMATAGSGDVLTGIITGLLSQGYNPLKASVLGVFLHGQAGDRVASQKGQENLIASDLCKEIKVKGFN